MSTLIDQWIADTVDILTDPKLVAALQKQAPEVFPWLEYRLETARLARLYAVMPPALPEPPKPVLPEHRKPTTEEWREAMVRRGRTTIGDDLAKVWLAFEHVDSVLDAREAKVRAVLTRGDLTDEDKEERIRAIKAMAQKQLDMLLEGTTNAYNGTTPHGSPPPPVILGQ
jgi:hypothetical protein